MKIATDTGYFIRFLEGQKRATQVWQEVIASQHSLIVPTVVLNEIFVHFFRRGLSNAAQSLLESLQNAPNIELSPLSVDMAIESARYRVGLQLSTIDSIILATALHTQCDLLLTSDNDLNQSAIYNLIAVEMLTK